MTGTLDFENEDEDLELILCIEVHQLIHYLIWMHVAVVQLDYVPFRTEKSQLQYFGAMNLSQGDLLRLNWETIYSP